MTAATRRRLSLWAPVVVYMLAIYVMSSRSEAPIPEGVTDKEAHISAYAGLGVLAVRAFAGGLPPRMTLPIATSALAMTVGYGIVDELHQSLVPGRVADPEDLYADAKGACLGLLGCWAWGIIAARVND